MFVTKTVEGALLERLRREALCVVSLDGAVPRTDVALTASVAQAHDAEWIVVDGYEFSPEYLSALRATGSRVLYIDDMGQGPFECDVVLNQNLHALDTSYSTAAHTKLLLGPTYALLRKEFAEDISIDLERASEDEPRILVTLGGADPENCTLKVIDALASLLMEGAEIRVIVGPAFREGSSVTPSMVAWSLLDLHPSYSGRTSPRHAVSAAQGRDALEELDLSDRTEQVGRPDSRSRGRASRPTASCR